MRKLSTALNRLGLLVCLVASICRAVDQVELEDQILIAKTQNTEVTNRLKADIATLEGYLARLTEKEGEPDIQSDVSKWEIVGEKKALVQEKISMLNQRLENWVNTEQLGDNYKLTQFYDDEISALERDKELMELVGGKQRAAPVADKPAQKTIQAPVAVPEPPAPAPIVTPPVVADVMPYDSVGLREKLTALPVVVVKPDNPETDTKAAEDKKVADDFKPEAENRVGKMEDLSKLNITEDKAGKVGKDEESQKKTENKEPETKIAAVKNEDEKKPTGPTDFKPVDRDVADEREKLTGAKLVDQPTDKPDDKKPTGALPTPTTGAGSPKTEPAADFKPSVNRLAALETIVALPPVVASDDNTVFAKTDRLEQFEAIAVNGVLKPQTSMPTEAQDKQKAKNATNAKNPAAESSTTPAAVAPAPVNDESPLSKLNQEQQELEKQKKSLEQSENQVIGTFAKLLNDRYQPTNAEDKTSSNDTTPVKLTMRPEVIDHTKPRETPKPLTGLNIAQDLELASSLTVIEKTAVERKRERKDVEAIKQKNKLIEEENLQLSAINQKLADIEEQNKILQREKNAIIAVENKVREQMEAVKEAEVLRVQRDKETLDKIMNAAIKNKESASWRRLQVSNSSKMNKHTASISRVMLGAMSSTDHSSRRLSNSSVIGTLINKHKLLLKGNDVRMLRRLEALEKQSVSLNVDIEPQAVGQAKIVSEALVKPQPIADTNTLNNVTVPVSNGANTPVVKTELAAPSPSSPPLIENNIPVESNEQLQAVQDRDQKSNQIDDQVLNSNDSDTQANLDTSNAPAAEKQNKDVGPKTEAAAPVQTPSDFESKPVVGSDKSLDQIMENDDGLSDDSDNSEDNDSSDDDGPHGTPLNLIAGGDAENLSNLSWFFKSQFPVEKLAQQKNLSSQEVNVQVEKAKDLLGFNQDPQAFNGSIAVMENRMQLLEGQSVSQYKIVVSKKLEGDSVGMVNVVEITKSANAKEPTIKNYQTEEDAASTLSEFGTLEKSLGVNGGVAPLESDNKLPEIEGTKPEMLTAVRQSVKKMALAVQQQDVKVSINELVDSLIGLYSNTERTTTDPITSALNNLKTAYAAANAYDASVAEAVNKAQVLLSQKVTEEFRLNGITSLHTILLITSYSLSDISSKLQGANALKPATVSGFEDLLDKLIMEVQASANFTFVFSPLFFNSVKSSLPESIQANLTNQDVTIRQEVNRILSEGVDSISNETQMVAFIETLELRDLIIRALINAVNSNTDNEAGNATARQISDQQLDAVSQELIAQLKKYTHAAYNKRLNDVFTVVGVMRSNMTKLQIVNLETEAILETFFNTFTAKYSDELGKVDAVQLSGGQSNDKQSDTGLVDKEKLKASLKEVLEYYAQNVKADKGNHVEKLIRILFPSEDSNMRRRLMVQGLAIEAARHRLSKPLYHLLNHFINLWANDRVSTFNRHMSKLEELASSSSRHSANVTAGDSA